MENNLKHKAYIFIKEKIVSNEYKPKFKLDEVELSKKLKMSRTPIREALLSLEQEDWVEIIQRKGIFVKEFTLKDINDIFQTRDSIEPLVLELAFPNLSTEDLVTFKIKFEKFKNLMLFSKHDLIELEKLDNFFHIYILEKSKNKYIAKIMKTIYDHNRGLKNLSSDNIKRKYEVIDEHLEIINTLLENNLEKAIVLTKKHLNKSKLDFLLNIGNLSL